MNPLKNPDAEACAQAIAKVIHDKAERQQLFNEFLAAHPELKRWEGTALCDRAVYLARELANAALSNPLATKHDDNIPFRNSL